MTGPRVGLIGARRRRQGLGPFVARFLQDAGATVAGFVGTSADSLEDARRGLAARGVDAPGFLDLAALRAAHELDALAILSPIETHREWLRAALDAGLHVLCEKPLLWGRDDDLATAEQLVAGFADAGLLLVENCQWPHSVPAYFALHPQLVDVPVQTFAMRMAPQSRGVTMIGDAMSHPLSVLQALVPGDDARVDTIAFSTREPDAGALDIRFRYSSGDDAVDVEVQLVQSDVEPREAGWAVNGCWAQRRVQLPEYALSLADGDRVVPLPDPLEAHVHAFVRALRAPDRGKKTAETRRILPRLRALLAIADTYTGPP